jgi:transcriptional regulator with GAF, ATPase, and Fis domain
MAVALDRVRLIERERERQREEKERLEAEVSDLRRVVHGSRLAYRSAAIESLLTTARKVAHTDTTVLITGESGTGKEMLASTLHELSGRHERAMVVVDCSAISPTLIESELFGHERGAFTGAHARKPGRFAQADRSTVFLDEIGELPLDLQSKLLRFVQDKQFTPVGGVVPQTVDVRIIAATNVDLREKVAEGTFRPDLFHRLNVVRLHVPPLRERQEDIVHLATVFLKQFAALYRRPAHHFTPHAEAALEAYRWPGNVRELQNLILTSVLFCDAPEVDVEDLQGLSAPEAAGTEGVPDVQPPDAAAGDESEADPAARPAQPSPREIRAALASGRPGPARLASGWRRTWSRRRPAVGGGLPPGRGPPRHPRHDVPAEAPGRGRSPRRRARPPLPPLGGRDGPARGLHSGAAGGDRRVRVGGGVPARRDRRHDPHRHAHGGCAARSHRTHSAPPQGGARAPFLKSGAPEFR